MPRKNKKKKTEKPKSEIQLVKKYEVNPPLSLNFMYIELSNGKTGFIYEQSLAILRAAEIADNSLFWQETYLIEIEKGIKDHNLLVVWAKSADSIVLSDYILPRKPHALC